MRQRFLVVMFRFLICLAVLWAHSACISSYTVQALHDLNPAAEIVDTCVRIPTVASGVGVYAHKRRTRETVSDRDPTFEQFAETADVFYFYDPGASRQTSQRLPWPYQDMTCDTLSSPDTPPLPKGMVPIPISSSMREALVASLSEQYFAQKSASLASELEKKPVEKRFLAQMGPRLLTLPPQRSKEKLDEVSQMLRDAIRESLPTVERQRVYGPTVEQISIIDTKTGQIIGGALAGVPGVVVPGGALITDAIMASGVMPQPTREFMLGKGGVEMGGGIVQMVIGGSAALGGGGATITGGGAIAGVPVCVAGVALATNGAITFFNGAKTVIVAVCHWNELPKAADTPALASTTLPVQSAAAGPVAAQATSGGAPLSAAKGARPAAQQTTSTPPTVQTPSPAKPAVTVRVAKPAQVKATVVAETTTTTRFKTTGKTVTKRGETTTTTTTRATGKPSATGTPEAPVAKGAKRGPKTDPEAPHNAARIKDRKKLEAEGSEILTGGGKEKEKLVKTPGGLKSGRRPDTTFRTPEGAKRGRNYGKTNADGTPVKREQEALDDLNKHSDTPTDFVPYDR